MPKYSKEFKEEALKLSESQSRILCKLFTKPSK